ncbi:hypothetical protein SCLCIDRAFT_1223023, partial [Scleroderma citrinum Foug A]
FVLVNGCLSKTNLFSLIAGDIKKALYLTPICHRALSCSLWLTVPSQLHVCCSDPKSFNSIREGMDTIHS